MSRQNDVVGLIIRHRWKLVAGCLIVVLLVLAWPQGSFRAVCEKYDSIRRGMTGAEIKSLLADFQERRATDVVALDSAGQPYDEDISVFANGRFAIGLQYPYGGVRYKSLMALEPPAPVMERHIRDWLAWLRRFIGL